MKIIALDIGDKWTGIAISDPLGILARPYNTIKTSELDTMIENLTSKENVSVIVVGLPTTLRGTQSDQTKKIIAITQELEKKFPSLSWKLWDERFTSRQAATKKKKRKTTISRCSCGFNTLRIPRISTVSCALVKANSIV